jgi:hypothetical protein
MEPPESRLVPPAAGWCELSDRPGYFFWWYGYGTDAYCNEVRVGKQTLRWRPWKGGKGDLHYMYCPAWIIEMVRPRGLDVYSMSQCCILGENAASVRDLNLDPDGLTAQECWRTNAPGISIFLRTDCQCGEYVTSSPTADADIIRGSRRISAVHIDPAPLPYSILISVNQLVWVDVECE